MKKYFYASKVHNSGFLVKSYEPLRRAYSHKFSEWNRSVRSFLRKLVLKMALKMLSLKVGLKDVFS